MKPRTRFCCFKRAVALWIAFPLVAWAQQGPSVPTIAIPPLPPVATVSPRPPQVPTNAAPLQESEIGQGYLPSQPPRYGSTLSTATAKPPRPARPAGPQTVPSALSQAENKWINEPVAVLGTLNPENGTVSSVVVPVGANFTKGKLRVAVQACVIRPPGAIPDAAVFLTVTEARGPGSRGPLFRGWLVRSEPGAAVVADSSLTFRVINCRSRPALKTQLHR